MINEKEINIGLKISEQEYRELKYPSYSMLSSVSKVNALAVGGTKEDIGDLDSIIIGSLVDSIITDGGTPSNVVVLSKKPTGKPLKIIKALYKRTDLANKYILSVKNKKMILEELDREEYYQSSSYNLRLSKLTQYSIYARALSKFGDNAMFATKYQINEANALVYNLYTRFPFLKEKENIIFQLKLLGKINNIEVKGMLDFIYINHKQKLIIPFDLKTGMGVHNTFFEKGYLGWNYYIQASMYKHILEQNIRKYNSELDEYKIDNFRFMYCGRMDRLPIIYKVTDKLHDAGFDGFKYNNKTYPGVNELLEEYEYYKNNPNCVYKKGFDTDEVVFDDSFI